MKPNCFFTFLCCTHFSRTPLEARKLLVPAEPPEHSLLPVPEQTQPLCSPGSTSILLPKRDRQGLQGLISSEERSFIFLFLNLPRGEKLFTHKIIYLNIFQIVLRSCFNLCSECKQKLSGNKRPNKSSTIPPEDKVWKTSSSSIKCIPQLIQSSYIAPERFLIVLFKQLIDRWGASIMNNPKFSWCRASAVGTGDYLSI